MKIANIIANIDYIEPSGSLKNYKHGIGSEMLQSKYNVPCFEGAMTGDVQVLRTNPTMHEMDTSKLRDELSRVRVAPLSEPKAEIVGKE